MTTDARTAGGSSRRSTRTAPRRADVDERVGVHAVRGASVHVALRGLLVVFAVAAVWWEPPEFYAVGCRWLAVGYVVWAVLIGVWFRRDPRHLTRLTWLVLTVDLLLFGALVQLTGVSDELSWTPYILVNGFLLIPLLAATQLRPALGAAIGAGTTVLYFVSSAAARTYGSDDSQWEPWSSVVLRTFVVAAVSLAAVQLSRVQRDRVAEIGRLAADRAQLLTRLGSLEDRQRRDLAETLHDGALQYLLGARFELEEARDTGDAAAFDRVDEALTQSTRLLRSLVTTLHPAVLAQAGLAQAVRDLAGSTAERGGLAVTVEVHPDAGEWGGPSVPRDPSDLVVYSAIREMLANVVRHARARTVHVALDRTADRVTAVVTDDGVGVDTGVLARRLAAGHIGVASHRLRVEAAGGSLTLEPVRPHGTRARIEVPLSSDRWTPDSPAGPSTGGTDGAAAADDHGQ